MARYPDWFDRLPTIREQLAASPTETLGRAEVQSLFNCSERDSLRLLNRFGATREADALQLDRTSLLAQLQTISKSPAYQRFCRQQKNVAQTVALSKEEAKARWRRVPGAVEFQPGRSLKDLPADITLEAGRLEVRFQLEEDLWDLLDKLADIANADPDAFRARIEPSQKKKRTA